MATDQRDLKDELEALAARTGVGMADLAGIASEIDDADEQERVASATRTLERVRAGEPCRDARVVMAELKVRLEERIANRHT